MKALTLKNVSIAYDGKNVIDNCSFTLESGRILSLLGASGCGKSTLLKAIAGLLPLTTGEIALDDTVLSKEHWHIAPVQRGVGMIFQDYALFPHLTVAENIEFGLFKQSKQERHKSTQKGLELVRLEAFANRYPHELSGGQQQRVAIARALVCQPNILLFDEPFSNLDIAVREILMHDIKTLLKSQNITAIFVTHDKNEAFAMADSIAIIQDGKIAQFGDAQDVYDFPTNRYVAEFLGNGVLIPAQRDNTSSALLTPLGTIENATLDKILVLDNDHSAYSAEAKPHDPYVYLRPHQVIMKNDTNGQAIIKSHSFRGDLHFYELALGNDTLRILSQQRVTVGERVQLSLHLG